MAGALIGLINGVFGGGGGMVCVPALRAFAGLDTRTAHATAIAVMLPVSVVSGLFYITAIPGPGILLAAAAGVFAGGVFGAALLGRLRSASIRILFAIVLAAAGLRMLIG